MTIIAVDYTSIVADGLALDGTVIVGEGHQKLRLDRERGVITAMAGVTGMHNAVHSWLVQGADLDSVPRCHGNASWSALLVSPEGLFLYTSECPYGEKYQPPYAIGADRDMASGVMHAHVRLGKTSGFAREAVEIVCRSTNAAGGVIQEINFQEVLGFALFPPELAPAPATASLGVREWSDYRTGSPWI